MGIKKYHFETTKLDGPGLHPFSRKWGFIPLVTSRCLRIWVEEKQAPPEDESTAVLERQTLGL